MESNYRNREFEQYIKESADQYRMFPSEKVWKGVHNTLHTRRKWYGIGLAFLLLMTGTAVTWVMMSYPVSKNQSVAAVNTNDKATKAAVPSEVSPEAINNVLPFKNRSVSKTTDPAAAPVILPAITAEEIAGNTISFSPAEQPVISRNERIQSVPFAGPQKNTIASSIGNPFNQFTDDDDKSLASETRRQSVKMSSSDRPLHNEINYPGSFEDATNAYIPEKIAKKLSWQFFVTPTISYRKLDENKSFNNLTAGYPFASSLTDVNKAVTHKPDMGLQIGLSARYPVTRNLSIRGGLQFNLNRYDIKAFAYNPEVATINLNGTNGNSSVSTLTQYRTYSGYKSDWLKNFYFSVSVPIGAELKLFGNKNTSFGIAGTVQPTYILKDRAYLISSDYKNYAKVPWLIRHVNLNTGFEAFVNYHAGNTQWQVGPQVRYQVLSSFHNKYPVKENLFDFGMKIGLTLNQ
ncbi:MAG: hypothetical protein ABIR18_14685 [Chitinophagaceae bacterium]